MPNIPEVVKSKKTLTAMNKGVLASELNKTLRGRGPFTVFAPSDRAFGKLESGTLEGLLKPENKVQLTALLSRHIIAYKVNFKNLKEGDKLKTLKGNEVTVTIRNGKICIDDATIQNQDIESSNGVIHSLDTVLID
ncbi:fasciclin domain-containing protein [Ilyomonas limi]|nr:fasciclin domain-containing protein [Ilyomonas limi]